MGDEANQLLFRLSALLAAPEIPLGVSPGQQARPWPSQAWPIQARSGPGQIRASPGQALAGSGPGLGQAWSKLGLARLDLSMQSTLKVIYFKKLSLERSKFQDREGEAQPSLAMRWPSPGQARLGIGRARQGLGQARAWPGQVRPEPGQARPWPDQAPTSLGQAWSGRGLV